MSKIIGVPCIAGTRIPPSCISDLARAGHDVDRIMAEYPTVTMRQVAEALAWQTRPLAARKAALRAIGER